MMRLPARIGPKDRSRPSMAGTLSVGTRRLPELGESGRGGGWLRQLDRTDQSDQSDPSDPTDQTDLATALPIGQDRH